MAFPSNSLIPVYTTDLDYYPCSVGAIELGTGAAGFDSKSTYVPPQEPQPRRKSRVDEMVEDYQNKKAFDSMYEGRDKEY